ncbi:MAG: metallophosphoesterase family protein [Anaerolineae bacterium]|nr:metallophosphoesterase family protein [Anaerolineae bacterium]
MASIVVLADIHGNLSALEAVRADLAQLAPDQVIVAGDVINRGPQSRECLQAVRATGWTVLFGNHEEYILKLADGSLPTPDDDEDWWLPAKRIADELSAEELAYLAALPREHSIALPGLPTIRVLHGSLRALNDGIGFWMSDADLRDAVGAAPEAIVVGAHTHRPYSRHIDGHWALNCGAVGFPFNGNPAAQYLLLESGNGAWTADFRAVPYDRAPVLAAWERTDILQRSVIARIFRLEMETASPHLNRYDRFCAQRGLTPGDPASFERYLADSAQFAPRRAGDHQSPSHPAADQR